jgi:muramoyltetrapeptide carboxypeptidase
MASRFGRLGAEETIGVVATGFAVRRAAARAGIARLRAAGHRVVEGAHLFDRHGCFAGADRDRARDLNRMLRDPRVRCVWFARGGYGTARILAQVDWDALARDPKLLIGYSDLTALFARPSSEGIAPCVYGPVVAELGDAAAYDARSLARALQGEEHEIRFPAARVIAPGVARGPLLGGNLTVLVHLLGTPWAPRLDGAILLLEDAGEELYRLDRLLAHLTASGALDRVAGVVLGRFVVPKRKRAFPPDRTFAETIADAFGSLGVPVVSHLPFGHVPGKHALPLGVGAELNTRAGRLTIGTALR